MYAVFGCRRKENETMELLLLLTIINLFNLPKWSAMNSYEAIGTNNKFASHSQVEAIQNRMDGKESTVYDILTEWTCRTRTCMQGKCLRTNSRFYRCESAPSIVRWRLLGFCFFEMVKTTNKMLVSVDANLFQFTDAFLSFVSLIPICINHNYNLNKLIIRNTFSCLERLFFSSFDLVLDCE